MLKLLKYLLTVVLLLLFFGIENVSFQPEFSKTKANINNLKFKSIYSINPTVNKTSDYSSKKRIVSNDIINADFAVLAPRNISGIFSEKGDINSLKKEKNTFKTEIKNINISFLRVVFDNDIFDNTDYYYTNGVRLELVFGFIANAPTSKILLGLKKSKYDFQGFSLVQNIYTPVNPDTKIVSTNDRPFSAYLTIGHFRESINIEKGLRMKSEFSVGVLGPASLGGRVQSSIHEIEPIGWENQIKNDIVIDYSLQLDKTILGKKSFEISALGKARFGTVYNKLGGGASFRLGRFIPILDNQWVGNKQDGSNKFNFWFFSKAQFDFVLYDATLQGGLFNNQNLYTISASQMNRFVLKASAGMAFYYGRLGLEIENFYLSPEFKGAYEFRHGRINLVIGF